MIKDKEKNVLFVPVVIMTTSIIVLSVLSQYFVDESLKGIKVYVNTIDVVNKERMLSQDIVKSIATDNLMGQLDGIASLDSLLNTFKHLHHIILTGDKQLNLQPLNNQFTKHYIRLDTAFANFCHIVDANIGDDSNNNTLFFDMLAQQNIYLTQLDNLVDVINNYSNNKVNTLQLVEMLAMSGSLLIVALEFTFIFLPSFKKIKKQNEHLRQIAFNQSHLVRHPLTSLKELLYLINISKDKEELTELLQMANKEADELDNIISDTVYNAVQSKPARGA